MGQRHQIYIKVKNPNEIKRENIHLDDETKWRNRLEDFIQAKKTYKKHKIELGEEKETILAFHHQWLFGLTAIGNVYQFMKFLECVDEEYGLFSEYFLDYKCSVQDFIDTVKNIMTIQNNVIGHKFGGRVGIERLIYLNAQLDGDYAQDYRESYANGDNNDGCTIIDAINKKYCFVDFHGIREETLPLNTPISATDYYKVYYPVEEHLLSEYDIRNSTAEKVAKKNLKTAKKIECLFNGIKLMTQEDLENMFPKIFNKKKVEVL